jgi:hypothetical protein
MPEAGAISLGRDFVRALDPVILARDCGINPDPVTMGQEHAGGVNCAAYGSICRAGHDCFDLAESAAEHRAI